MYILDNFRLNTSIDRLDQKQVNEAIQELAEKAAITRQELIDAKEALRKACY